MFVESCFMPKYACKVAPISQFSLDSNPRETSSLLLKGWIWLTSWKCSSYDFIGPLLRIAVLDLMLCYF